MVYGFPRHGSIPALCSKPDPEGAGYEDFHRDSCRSRLLLVREGRIMNLYEQLAKRSIDLNLYKLEGYSSEQLQDFEAELADELCETVYQFVREKSLILVGPDPDEQRDERDGR
jgi:hypothetical protein